MKQSKDPFEAALEEQEESLPDSPIGPDELEGQTQSAPAPGGLDDDFESLSAPMPVSGGTNINAAVTKNKDDDEEEEEENVDVELAKFPSSADPSKMAKMQ